MNISMEKCLDIVQRIRCLPMIRRFRHRRRLVDEFVYSNKELTVLELLLLY